ncbi:uncharacterized protein BX664DRAFT_376555 [Halteromyces radiatus]|uniref:uncharacterized protein n=1 Tax=Halteromyces radiatus TaxID=101107 RepID=UPI00221E82D2|nr:uncharacterized protein BX664DRAFT_376555 [Halteromyces radiatus]KAI8079759.1 hypothetical protein BX664DRAFT_376555 [Halteromyces radiatus]
MMYHTLLFLSLGLCVLSAPIEKQSLTDQTVQSESDLLTLERRQGQNLPLPVSLPTSMGLPSIDDLGVLESVLEGGLGGSLGGGLPLGDTSNLIPIGDLGGVLGGLGGL